MNAGVEQAGRRNLQQLIQLRWLAVAGQLVTIVSAQFLLATELPLREMLLLLAALALFNIASWLRSRFAVEVSNSELFAGLLVDIAVLSGQLFYSGGVTNPFIFLFLLQVALGAVLLRQGYVWAVVALTSLCFVALTQWHRPLSMPDMRMPVLSVHYVGGLLLCFMLNAALLVFFIHRIGRNLRRRDAHLADLRQRAAEEEHIVRMGLLASGAAHELGTPLATLSVILGDWSRMAPFAADPELREDIQEMQTQLQRCKTILTGILLSAGETRGEAPAQTRLHEFLDELVEEWRRTRPVEQFDYDRQQAADLSIISDSALKQMLCNILDNALEASPDWLGLQVRCDERTLTLAVRDLGPGFAPAMLARFGKPYQSSKGRPGGGLGLFLSVNVARTLGGSVSAGNRADGGAEVLVRLPLSSIMLEPAVDEGAGRRDDGGRAREGRGDDADNHVRG
ncbi:MAG: ATP-binding protein [Burkholderiaceae bacterium]